MALFQVDNFAEFDATLDAKGCRRVWAADRPEVSACHVHPKDMGGAIVSFDEMRPPQEWVWGGPDWRSQRATDAERIVGFTVAAPEPAKMLKRWSEVLDVAVVDGERLELDDGTFVKFLAGPNAAIVGITILVAELGGRHSLTLGDVDDLPHGTDERERLEPSGGLEGALRPPSRLGAEECVRRAVWVGGGEQLVAGQRVEV